MTTSDAPSTRVRLLDATVTLMRTKGAAASGTKEILERAGAPRGSFYFHFPGGKDQLVLEALDQAAGDTLASMVAALADDSGEPADQVVAIFDAIEAELVAEDYVLGCAVGVTTLETAGTAPVFQRAVGAAFEKWTATLAARLLERGVAGDRAAALADLIVAGMEGATMLSRAQRSVQPLRNTADMLALTVHASLHPEIVVPQGRSRDR